jgi:two-component system C4-dicarboxylate transport sensor histidine kinase DctB
MPVKPHPYRRLAWLPALIASAGLLLAVYQFAARQGEADNLARGQRQLQLMAPELESALEKFETLPYVIGFQETVAEALAHPGDRHRIDRLNRMFKATQLQSKIGAIYLMDRDGNTIAASNSDQPLTFVGKNFGYRPYFREARAGRAGRFYGIGSTTGEAGYFIAQPVRVDDAVAGVVAVKISLDEFERNWKGSEDTIVLADRAGVVFLSNRPDWKYRSLNRLSPATQRELASTLQYALQPIASIAGAGAPHVVRQVGRLGWELKLFPAPGNATRNAALWALAAALVLASGVIAAWAVHQRRRRLEEQRTASAALQRAARELDDRLVERTALLRQANQDLEARYATLKQTEYALRSTQDELVQAGKLAMLGQMAAGVTHELNQPLAAIRAFADNAITFLERGQAAKASANLSHIGDASARMGAIIAQLKGFARRSDSVATIDIAQSIRASAFLLDSEFRRLGAELHIEPPRESAAPVMVTGDAVRIEQVFINLLRNALDAVEAAPLRTVTVTLEQDGGYAVVRIADTGPGIPGAVAAHLFEPFFTTKPSGKGLGLGLAISSSIVQAMNGQLTGSNRAAGGAQFEVRLPLSDKGD